MHQASALALTLLHTALPVHATGQRQNTLT